MGPQSFCHRVNLLNEDLNVGAYSLGGGGGGGGRGVLGVTLPLPPHLPESLLSHLDLRLRD